MASTIKHIRFKKRQGAKSFFDWIGLDEIMALKPTDHNQFENHRLTFYVLLVITAGEGRHHINFEEYTYGPGTVFALGPETIHKFERSEAEGCLLVFTEDFITQYLSEHHATRIFQLFNSQLASPRQQLGASEFAEMRPHLAAIREEYKNVQDDFSGEMIRSRLQIIFTQLLRLKSTEHPVLEQTKYLTQFLQFQALVEAHCETHQRVTFYADKLFVTTRTLNNITHSIVHKSAKAVISDVLLTKIKRLLINSDFNVTKIAYELGFRDASHLFKFFKNLTGLSPKAFQEQFGA